jgi:predicted nucleic acid-binding protein
VTFVLDASVLLKWFLDEPGSAAASDLKARYLAGDVAIAIPDLALYEIPNVLRFKRSIPQTELNAVMQAFWQLGLEIVAPTEPLLEDAVRLSYMTGLSLYDCAYLALARQLEARVLTADMRLHRAASGLVQATLLR